MFSQILNWVMAMLCFRTEPRVRLQHRTGKMLQETNCKTINEATPLSTAPAISVRAGWTQSISQHSWRTPRGRSLPKWLADTATPPSLGFHRRAYHTALASFPHPKPCLKLSVIIYRPSVWAVTEPISPFSRAQITSFSTSWISRKTLCPAFGYQTIISEFPREYCRWSPNDTHVLKYLWDG